MASTRQKVEQGSCKVVDGVLKSTDACAKFGNPEWKTDSRIPEIFKFIC